jgi:hypothetical protein
MVVVIPGVHNPRDAELLGVVHARDGLGFLFGPGQGGQEQGGQDGDDRNYDQ